MHFPSPFSLATDISSQWLERTPNRRNHFTFSQQIHGDQNRRAFVLKIISCLVIWILRSTRLRYYRIEDPPSKRSCLKTDLKQYFLFFFKIFHVPSSVCSVISKYSRSIKVKFQTLKRKKKYSKGFYRVNGTQNVGWKVPNSATPSIPCFNKTFQRELSFCIVFK